MPSANTVAQKPAGNSNPLSSCGHAWLLVCALRLLAFCANAAELTTHNAPRMAIVADNTFLLTFGSSHRPSGAHNGWRLFAHLLRICSKRPRPCKSSDL